MTGASIRSRKSARYSRSHESASGKLKRRHCGSCGILRVPAGFRYLFGAHTKVESKCLQPRAKIIAGGCKSLKEKKDEESICRQLEFSNNGKRIKRSVQAVRTGGPRLPGEGS